MVSACQRLATWGIASITFALAYGQFPLYKGNYNTYLLHGFAAAGRGQLAFDWLTGTIDPIQEGGPRAWEERMEELRAQHLR
jgi:hypothetical protein